MGLAEILTIIFVVCKLMGIITWAWWIVFLPMIIAVVVYVIMLVVWLIGIRNIKKNFDKFDIKF